MNLFGRFLGVLIALIFILIGAVLLLSNLGFLAVDPIELITNLWPLLLIAIGLYVIWMFVRPLRTPQGGVTVSEKLGGAARADVSVNFGAGELRITSLKDDENLFEGDFLSKPEKSVDRSGDLVKVKLSRSQWMLPPFFPAYRDDWRLRLNRRIAITLRLNTGASTVLADLSENLIDWVEVNTGASDVTVKLPKASGYTRAIVKGGATNIKLEIPDGVGAKIRSTGALGSLAVDERRFPRLDSGFASPDYESASNRVDIEISTGVSSVTVS